MVITNDEALSRRMRLFHDKAWGYGDPDPDHYFLALNYRMTELQGAVALAQLNKLSGVVEARRRTAGLMTDLLHDLPGVHPPAVTPRATHAYWKYCLRIDEDVVGGGVNEFAARLKMRKELGLSGGRNRAGRRWGRAIDRMSHGVPLNAQAGSWYIAGCHERTQICLRLSNGGPKLHHPGMPASAQRAKSERTPARPDSPAAPGCRAPRGHALMR